MSLLNQLQLWQQAGLIRALDFALVKFIQQSLPDIEEPVLLAVALLSHGTGHSHVCLDLKQVLTEPATLLFDGDEGDSEPTNDPSEQAQLLSELQRYLSTLTLDGWYKNLRDCAAVCSGQDADIAASTTPFVLAGTQERPLFYLRRYWQCEYQIRQALKDRLVPVANLSDSHAHQFLNRLFADDDKLGDTPNWQKIACALAARTNFSIITGGPGTGKTTTVMRVLALLQGLRLEGKQRPFAIRLAAPTGKAAAQLSSSIAESLQSIPLPSTNQFSADTLRATIPTEVTTLHRLLGVVPGSRHFRHNASHPLTADLVVVDEASMVDVEMMSALLDALRPSARLLLIGDKDQLASVEAGYVFGDLCTDAAKGGYHQTTIDWLANITGEKIPESLASEQGTPLQQVLSMLRYSHRFEQGGPIHSLATLVNEGTYQGQPVTERWSALQTIFSAAEQNHGQAPVLGLLHQPQGGRDPSSATTVANEFTNDVKDLLIAGYKGYLTLASEPPSAPESRDQLDAWGLKVLKAHSQFQLLTALRRGKWGVDGLNLRIEQVLTAAGHLTSTEHMWYPGRPVLVTRNDYTLSLMNGDIGICLPCPGINNDEPIKLRVAFSDGQGGVRWVLPSRLQSVETVFAMTVHKSQGSEFTHAALLLPGHDTPILTRELIYTGITRASKRFTLIYGDQQVLENGMQRRVERSSGLQGLAT